MAVLVNGTPTKFFVMERGLRQGDPISPGLFLIVVEGLHMLLNKATEIGLISGWKSNDDTIHVTHLQFADDTMLFLKAEIENLRQVKRILSCFELVSGLSINYEKSVVYPISKSIENMQQMAAVLGCRAGTLPIKYLGMSLGSNPREKKMWDPIIKRMKKRLTSWKRNHLSFAGRLALINSVLSALPTFYMMIFRAPKGAIKDMDKVRRRFLWGGSSERRVWNKVRWAKVCKPKDQGGLGIADLEARNKALLCKWWWRYGRESNSLWRKVIEAIYGTDTQTWRPATENHMAASQVWRQILKLNYEQDTKQIIDARKFRWVVGDGKEILLWWDCWYDETNLKERFPRLYMLSIRKLMTLEDAVMDVAAGAAPLSAWFRRNLRSWETENLNKLVDILEKVQLNAGRRDSLAWTECVTGVYSTKRATKLLSDQNAQIPQFQFEYIWKIKVPAKVQTLLWLIVLNRLPSKSMLVEKKVKQPDMDTSCSHCGIAIEDSEHILYLCPVVFETWKAFMCWWGFNIQLPQHFAGFFKLIFDDRLKNVSLKQWRLAIGAALWTIWTARNDATFNEKKWTAGELMFTIKLRSWHWKRVLCDKEGCEEGCWWTEPRSAGNLNDPMEKSPKWCAPEEGSLKFNTDAAVNHAQSKAGIGGALRDYRGRIHAIFSYPLEYSAVETAELAAIKVAITKAVDLVGLSTKELIIESDSKIAVQWCLVPSSRPILLQKNFVEIDAAVKKLDCVVIQHVNRERNGLADSLAKMGIGRTTNCFLKWTIPRD